MKSWNPPKPRNWEHSKVSIQIYEELSVVDVGLSDQQFFRLLMRRKRSQALILNCAPEDVLSPTKVSKYFRRPGVLEVFWAMQNEMTSRYYRGVTTQEHLFLSTLRQKNREEETENEGLVVQAKTKRCTKKLSFELFMSSMHNTFTGWIFSGYMVYWFTNKHRNANSQQDMYLGQCKAGACV